MADDVEHKVASDTAPAFEREENGAGVERAGVQVKAPGDGEAGAKVVKICKACMVSQADGGEYCVNCGSELVPIRAVRESYVGEMVGGKYKIVDRLGAGGMGEVYLGLNEPLGQRVAVKFLSKKFTADEGIIMRFLNEARSYCKVNHPNAVTLLEYGQHDDGALYLITEFIEGKSLTDTLKEVGPFPLDQVLSVAEQICEVLSAAHSQGVIHRDLKPDNIMLMPTSRGRYAVKVLDFGIAKIVDDDHQHGPMTETGSVFGTPEFMSPEQARGDSADPRSDLYAVGIILFYVATGRLPFKGKNKLVVLNKQLNELAPRPSEARADIHVPPRLEAVILKCLHKEPDQRYQSADDLLEALEEVKSNKGPAPSSVVQTARLGAVSSEVSDAPGDTPSNPLETDHPNIHDSETVAYGLDASLNTDPERAASVDLGEIDNAEAAPAELDSVDMASEWADRSQEMYADSGRKKMVALIVVVLLAGAGVGLWALTGTDSASQQERGEQTSAADGVDPTQQDSPAAATQAEVDIDQVLATGQVLGSLSAAEDSLRHGDLAAARRSLDATHRLMSDDALPEDARKRREALERQISKEEEKRAKRAKREQQALQAKREEQARKKRQEQQERQAQREKEQVEQKEKRVEKEAVAAPEPADNSGVSENPEPAKNPETSDDQQASGEEGGEDGFALPPRKLD